MDGDPGPLRVSATPLASEPARRKARPGRSALGGVLSLALHLLFLASMVVGLRVMQPPPETQAIQVQLMPALDLPRAAPAPIYLPELARPTQRPPVLRPHYAPSIPATRPPIPPVPLPPAPPSPPGPRAGPLLDDSVGDGLRPSLSGRLGCDDPMSFHLTPAQQAVCHSNLGRMVAEARAARALDLNIADSKREAYDRAVRCRGATGGSIPSSAGSSDGTSVAGLGNVPSLRACPPSER